MALNYTVPDLVYDELDLSCSSIRLIELLPASHIASEIKCRLYTVQPTPGLRYVALSYVWGDEAIKYPILVNGARLMVTPNLHDALWSFRTNNILRPATLGVEAVSDGDGTTSLPLWVDAVCINQKESTERNHQVAQMSNIFSNATTVLSWLGMLSQPGLFVFHRQRELAFRAIGKIAQAIRVNPGSEDIETDLLEPGVERTGMAIFYQYGLLKQQLDESRRANKDGVGPVSQQHLDWTSSHGTIVDVQKGLAWFADNLDFWISDTPGYGVQMPYKLLEGFSSLEYWGRTWVVQELVLANPHAHRFVYDKHVISYLDLELFVDFHQYLKNNVPSWPATSAVKISNRYWKSFLGKNHAVFKTFRRARDLKQGHRTPLEIMRLARSMTATDPRDLVYGMAGVLSAIKPDYSKQVKEVYLDWFRECFSVSPRQALQCLWFSGSGVAINYSETFDLPSWIPWLSCLKGTVSIGRQSCAGFVNLDATVTVPAPALQHDILILHGVRYDTVKAILTTNYGGLRFAMGKGPQNEFRELCTDFLSWLEGDTIQGTAYPLYALFMVISKGKDVVKSDELRPHPQPESTGTQLFRLVLCEHAAIFDDKDNHSSDLECEISSDEDSMGGDYQDSEASQGQGDTLEQAANDRKWGLEVHFRDCMNESLNEKWMAYAKMLDIYNESTLLAYLWRLWPGRDKARGLIFRTHDGYLGVGPPGMATTDTVCLLDECSLPLVLRDLGSGRWQFVGACWVFGMMNGEEPDDRIARHELTIEKFELQ